jgi:electron transfer flavoprotein beta subunit
MNIIVCVKQVIDPEGPSASFKINTASNQAEMHGLPPVIDPYGEFAVESALRIKEAKGGKVTILSLGVNLLREVVKKTLAMGADELVLLEDEAFGGGDSYTTAVSLAAAIRKKADYNLILCGREASDTNAGQTGANVAEILGLPCVTLARKIEVGDGILRVERVNSIGYEAVEVPLPAVVTVSNEIGQPRYPTIKGIIAARKIEPVIWKPADIGLEPLKTGAAGRRAIVSKLFQPVRERECEIVAGETPEEMAVNLAARLRENRIL